MHQSWDFNHNLDQYPSTSTDFHSAAAINAVPISPFKGFIFFQSSSASRLHKASGIQSHDEENNGMAKLHGCVFF